MKKTTIIVPCAGRSTRYPNLRPKFLLANPNGNLMLFDAISKINLKNCNIVVTILAEHEKKYGIKHMLDKFFNNYKIKLCILNKETKSQSETVYETIKKEQIKTPFIVKDSDNIFKLDQVYESYNYVSVEQLEKQSLINASNKSYVQYDTSGLMTSIEEKKVISNTFSVGGYYFLNPEEFAKAFEELSKNGAYAKEIYISTIINHLIFEKKAKFKIKKISEYTDLGTIKEWMNYKNTQKTYFIDIDGVIVLNSGEFFKPYWGTSKGIMENVELIKKLYEEGNQIVLTTSRKEKYRKVTEKQLKKLGIEYHSIVMGLYHSQRILINDFTNSNPYPSAVAVNIPRDSNNLNAVLR